MESFTKLTALLFVSMFLVSTATPVDPDCVSCGGGGGHGGKPKPTPKPHKLKTPKGPIVKPTVVLPPVLPIPPVGGIVPPVLSVPPVSGISPLPPVVNPPEDGVGCPTPLAPPTIESCPIDTLKLGACVDLLGGLIHIGIGDPVVNTCCPVLSGLMGLEAAVCMCTTLKIKMLNIQMILPLALELLVTCGKTPPADYTCSIETPQVGG